MLCSFKYTLGAETFPSQKILEIFAFREDKLSRIGQNRIFRVLNFREWTEKLIFVVVVVVLRKVWIQREIKERKLSLVNFYIIFFLVISIST